jgi:hypothetical protein
MRAALAAIGPKGERRMLAVTKGVPMDTGSFKFGTYRHYRGDLYTAIGLVTHHETREPMVLYVSHEKGCVNCRPLHGWQYDPPGESQDPDGFCDCVTLDDGRLVPRFELVQEVQR